MKQYGIARWAELYENNRSRRVKSLAWVPIPNKMEGENFTNIMRHKDGATIFAVFILMVEIASKCLPRGILVRGNGKPHNVTTMAARCQCPAAWFEKALPYLEQETDWLTVQNLPDETSPQCHDGDMALPLGCHDGDEEGKGTEQKGREEKGKRVAAPKPSLEQVRLFCAKAGIPPSDADWFFYKCEGNGWTNGGKPIKRWDMTLTSWKSANYLPSQKNGQSQRRDPNSLPVSPRQDIH